MGSYQPMQPMRNSQRRPSVRVWPPDFQPPPGPSPRRRSPSPCPSRRYDSYVPPRIIQPLRDDYPNVYRPNNNWRPSFPPSRSPSPDRYDHYHPVHEPDSWDRSPAWQVYPSMPRSGRRSPPSPITTPKDRGRRDTMATPMFEPSDSWKQSHSDPRPTYYDPFSPSQDRFIDRRGRRSRERSPDRGPIRGPYSPSMPGPIPGGDRYRPEPTYSPREAYRPTRVADCYRPIYEEDRIIRPRERGSSADRSRKDSLSGTLADRSPRSVSSRGRSYSPSPSPPLPSVPSRIIITHRDTSAEAAERKHDISLPVVRTKPEPEATAVRELVVTTLQEHESRPPSRSSIASSRPSDRYPPADVTPEPSIPTSEPALLTTTELLPPVVVNERTPPIRFPKAREVTPPPIPFTDIPEHPLSPIATPPSREVTPPPSSPLHSPEPSIPAAPVVETEAIDIEIVEASPILSGMEYPDASRTGSIRSRSIAPMEVETTCSASTHGNLPSPISPPVSTSPLSSEYVDEHQAADSAQAQLTGSPLEEPAEQQDEEPMVVVIEPVLTPEVRERTPPSPIAIPTAIPNKVNIQIADDDNTSSHGGQGQDALRIVVMTRVLYDRQTRSQRVEPVLISNSTVCPRPEFEILTEGTTDSAESVPWSTSPVRQSLIQRFAEREAARARKIRRLQEQYMEMHEQWLAQCALLDSTTKPAPPDEPITPNPGRTTRRSAATLGDAVRSDLEMEQIIASLGNDDLTDPNHLAMRNVAVIPDMLSVVRGDVDYVFDDTNHLVHDAATFYGPDTGIHDWTEEEKKIFLDKFAECPKQFGVIAECLPNKSVSQCVDYYYLHKKALIDFRKAVMQMAPTKRKRGARRGKQKGNGLLADIRQHDDEMHRGAGPSAVNGPITRRKRVQIMDGTPTTTPTPEPEMKQRRRRANIGARVNAAAEADDDPNEQEQRPPKRGRRSRKPRQVAAPEDPAIASKSAEPTESTSRRRPGQATVQWSEDDKNIFIVLLSQYGDDFKRIAASMPNKTTIQVSNYYKSNLIDLELQKVAAMAPKRSPTPETVCDRDEFLHYRDFESFFVGGIPSPTSNPPEEEGSPRYRAFTSTTASSSHEQDPPAVGSGALTDTDVVMSPPTIPSILLDAISSGDAGPHPTNHIQSSRSEHTMTDDSACQPSPTATSNALPHSHTSPICPAPADNRISDPKRDIIPRIRGYSAAQATHIAVEADRLSPVH